ncbi:hypothetical protein Tco_1104067 [Tanacetum coccineum]
MGLELCPEIQIRMGNGNVVTAPVVEGNGNGINGTPNEGGLQLSEERSLCSNSRCTVKPRKRDAAYLQQQLQIAQEEEAGIQSTQVECEFMAAADAYEETERVKMDQLRLPYIKLKNDMQQKIERLQAQLGDLKGKSCDTQCASNTLDPLFQKLEDEKVSLESQVLNMPKKMLILRPHTRTCLTLSK